jgi:hypothetical protein
MVATAIAVNQSAQVGNQYLTGELSGAYGPYFFAHN